MKISISKEAFAWYKEELQPQSKEYIRFFVQYGGCSTVQKGFSLGVCIATPISIGVVTTIEDISFYVEEEDVWYFDNHDLQITFSEEDEYPVIAYLPQNEERIVG